MATAIGDLVIRLNAHTRGAEAGLRRVRGVLGTTRAAVVGLSRAFTRILGPIAGVYGLFRLASAGEQFNRKMLESLAIMGDVSDAMRNEMRQTAIDTAKVTAHSAEDIAKAYFYLASAGMDAAQSVAAMPQVAAFARAGQFDLARAVSLASDAQKAMGMSSRDAQENLAQLARVTDVLVGANTLANASTEQFSESLTTKAGAAFRLLNKDIEEAVATLSVLADQGRKGAEAGTQLSRVMIGLKTNAIRQTAAFEKYGVVVFDGAGKMRHMADIIEDVEQAFRGMSDAQKHAAILEMGFTKRSADVLAMMVGTSAAIRERDRQLRRMGGVTQEVMDKQLTPFQKGWAQLRATLTDVGGRLMEWLGPKLGTAARGLVVVIETLRVPVQAAMLSFRELGGLVVDVFQLGWDYIGQFAGGLQQQLGDAFQGVIGHLDTMLGSLEGWRHGASYIMTQTTLAFEALWRTTINWFQIKWEETKNWFGQLWTSMGELGVEKAMPSLSRLFIWVRRKMAEMRGEKWLLTPEEEEGIVRSEQQRMLNQLAQYREQLEQKSNAKIAKLRREHERQMARIGEKSLKATEEWEAKMKKLPKLSDRFRVAFAKIAEAGKPPKMAGAGEGAWGLGGTAGKPALQFAGAVERGSAEAYSAILKGFSAMQGKGQAEDARKTARNTRATVGKLTDIEREIQELIDAQDEGMDIPGG